MFYIAANAAANAAAQAVAIEKTGTNKKDKSPTTIKSTPTKRRNSIPDWSKLPPKPIPGVRPILKRQDTHSTVMTASVSSKNDISVTFTSLDIAEHGIQMGDCPYCDGAPLAINDTCLSRRTMTVDEFEDEKAKRERREFLLSPSKRSHILLAMGYSVHDIADAAIATQRARFERALSLQNRKWDSFNAIGEQVSRKLRRMVGTDVVSPSPKVNTRKS